MAGYSPIDRTYTIRGFEHQLLGVWQTDPNTNAASWVEEEIHRGSSVLARERATGGTTHYFLDHLGTPRAITSATGTLLGTQQFDPWGFGGTTGGGALQFTSHERDAVLYGTGNTAFPDYMHARYYDVSGGRFLAVDPYEFGELQCCQEEVQRRFRQYLARPQVWNRYSYVENNPMKYVDPDGKEAIVALGGTWAISGSGTAAGAAGATAATGGAVIGVAAAGAFAVGWSVGSLINEIPAVSSTVTKAFGLLLDNPTVLLAQNNRHNQDVVAAQLVRAGKELGKIGSAGGPGKDPDFNHHKSEIKAMLDRALPVARRLPPKAYDEVLRKVRKIGNEIGLEY
jgi:RHS repeat-associated protein